MRPKQNTKTCKTVQINNNKHRISYYKNKWWLRDNLGHESYTNGMSEEKVT
jgi:hypothetical protein